MTPLARTALLKALRNGCLFIFHHGDTEGTEKIKNIIFLSASQRLCGEKNQAYYFSRDLTCCTSIPAMININPVTVETAIFSPTTR